jgi:hypothetical protein
MLLPTINTVPFLVAAQPDKGDSAFYLIIFSAQHRPKSGHCEHCKVQAFPQNVPPIDVTEEREREKDSSRCSSMHLCPR